MNKLFASVTLRHVDGKVSELGLNEVFQNISLNKIFHSTNFMIYFVRYLRRPMAPATHHLNLLSSLKINFWHTKHHLITLQHW